MVGAGHRLEVDGQEQHSLADVVVQFARDSGALRFLRPQQAGREVAVALVTANQRILTLTKIPLCAPSSCSLNQQTRNEQRLCGNQQHGGEDVPSVLVPEAWITKADERSVR